MRHILLLTLSVFVFHANIANGQAPVSTSLAEYQKAFYLFHKGDCLESLEVSGKLLNTDQRNGAILLLRLSDIKLRNSRDYPSLDSRYPVDQSLLITLLDAVYRLERYEESLKLSRYLEDTGMAKYYEGMSLLRLNRLEDAAMALSKVPGDDNLFPYAGISLAQISVMKGDLKEAGDLLRRVIATPFTSEDIKEKAHLLLGQVKYEEGHYSEALEQFLMVRPGSPFFRDARTGAGWCLVTLKRYEKAVDLVDEIRKGQIFDLTSEEIQGILVPSYLGSGRIRDAIWEYQVILANLSATEDMLDQIIRDRSAREGYIKVLMGGDPGTLSEEDRRLFPLLRGDPRLSPALEEIRSLQILNDGFLRKEKEAAKKRTYLENKKKGLTSMLRGVEKEVDHAKEILQAMEGKKRDRQLIGFLRGDDRHSTALSYFPDDIYRYWETALNRKPTEEAKILVKLILLDWMYRGNPDWQDPPIVRHIIDFARMKKVEERPEEIGRMLDGLEMIGRDIRSVREKKMIPVEERMSLIRETVEKRIRKVEESLKGMDGLKTRLRKNISDTGTGVSDAVERVDRLISERALKIKYEISDYRSGVVAGLETAKRELER